MPGLTFLGSDNVYYAVQAPGAGNGPLPVTTVPPVGPSATEVQGTAPTGSAPVGNPLYSSGLATTIPAVYTNNTVAPLSMTLNGGLRVVIGDVTSSTGANVANGTGALGGLAGALIVTTFARLVGPVANTFNPQVDTLGALAAAAGAGVGIASVEEAGRPYVNIATATTTLAKSGKTFLRRIVVGTPAAGTISLYDALTATGTPVSIITLGAVGPYPPFYDFDVALQIGCTVVTSAAMNLTVVLR